MAACPKCGGGPVELEEVEGVSVCAACGWVVSDDALVPRSTFDEGGKPLGVYVRGADTGERAGAFALQAQGPGLSMQRTQRAGGEAKLKARVREFGALLQLQPPVLEQALHVAERAVPHCLGSWRRDNLAAAAAYAAARLNRLPLTLADLSSATQLDTFALGRHYCALCRLLALQPPLLEPADLLPRSADRVTGEPVRAGALATATAAAVQRDAGMLLGWMARQLNERRFPMACVGAALVLAGEMNAVALSLEHVSASLPLSRSTLERKLAQARQRLLQLATLLPYGAAITLRSVGSHARTIIQLSTLVGATTNGGPRLAAGTAGQPAAPAPGGEPPSPSPAPAELDGGAAEQTAQPAHRGGSPHPAGSAPDVAQRPTAGAETQQHKRARLQAPASPEPKAQPQAAAAVLAGEGLAAAPASEAGGVAAPARDVAAALPPAQEAATAAAPAREAAGAAAPVAQNEAQQQAVARHPRKSRGKGRAQRAPD